MLDSSEIGNLFLHQTKNLTPFQEVWGKNTPFCDEIKKILTFQKNLF